ncbi:MAG TPA: ABA4-like family protein [Allosphingosinicella sp.]
MLDPSTTFDLAGPIVLGSWAGLILALFVKPARPVALTVTQFVAPGLLAIAYVLLIWVGMGAEGGGFGSIAEIRALFADDSALVAGWFHYLAFDLFVGSWIVRDHNDSGVPALLVLPCLPLTFLFGPAGLLLYLALRLAFRGRVPVLSPETQS